MIQSCEILAQTCFVQEVSHWSLPCQESFPHATPLGNKTLKRPRRGHFGKLSERKPCPQPWRSSHRLTDMHCFLAAELLMHRLTAQKLHKESPSAPERQSPGCSRVRSSCPSVSSLKQVSFPDVKKTLIHISEALSGDADWM